MATGITIMGGTGQDTINFAFTVTGTHTTSYAETFAATVNALLSNAPTTPLAGDSTAGSSFDQTVYVLTPPSDSDPSTSYTLMAGAYAVDSLSSAVSISLAGSDSVLVGGVNNEASLTASNTGSNQVIFITGQNEFDGTNDSGGDTVVAGSGQDSIYTSFIGGSTVYSGTGEALITLQDTTAAFTGTMTSTGGTAYTLNPTNDFVYLQDGSNTVDAYGSNDVVFATTEGQTIYGNAVADSTPGGTFLDIVITPNSDGSANGNDVVQAAYTGTTDVFDSSSNNSVYGGAGSLYFIGGDSVSASLTIGAGVLYSYGADGDSITLSTQAGDTTGYAYFVAGAGNETLNGAAATSTLYLFGASTSAGGATPNDSIVGGAGANLLAAGAGSDTLQGGSGQNYFEVDSVAAAGANILLTDFVQNGQITGTLILDQFSAADANSIYSDTTTDSSGNLVATIGDSTTITFTGISSGSQLQGHIITFTS